MHIRWNSAVIDYFIISDGVKQGGVLCHVWFSLYLDQLMYGCYMNGLFTGFI